MGNFNYAALLRLRHGVSPEQALAEIDVVQARFPVLARSTFLRSMSILPETCTRGGQPGEFL
jgi:hypothetical protein